MAGLVVRAALWLGLMSISFACLRLFLQKYQDADFGLHFYEHFGEEPTRVLRDKVVWVTGASSGIGEQLAYAFVKHGSKVVLSARRVKELERVKAACVVLGKKHDETFDADNILVLPMDSKDFDTHDKLTKQVLEHFGQIDVLLNNAGIYQVAWARTLPLKTDRHLMDVNFIGVVSLTKAVLPHMIKRKQGYIGTVNSCYGKFSQGLQTSYVASKFALKGYFDALRVELLPHNIQVSNFMVGPVNTPLVANAVTDKGKTFRNSYTKPKSDLVIPMAPSRCAHLIVTSLVNNLEETWISPQPVLDFYYINQYLPRLWARLGKTLVYQFAVEYAKDAGLPPP